MLWRRATMGTLLPGTYPVRPAETLARHRSKSADARPAPSLRLPPLRSSYRTSKMNPKRKRIRRRSDQRNTALPGRLQRNGHRAPSWKGFAGHAQRFRRRQTLPEFRKPRGVTGIARPFVDVTIRADHLRGMRVKSRASSVDFARASFLHRSDRNGSRRILAATFARTHLMRRRAFSGQSSAIRSTASR
jgi:hypothetical protein